jgi:UDP-2,3-diacylglucosamine hydrolase
VLIHGHTHRPAIHAAAKQGAKRVVLGDWYEQGSLLSAQDRDFDLRNMPA